MIPLRRATPVRLDDSPTQDLAPTIVAVEVERAERLEATIAAGLRVVDEALWTHRGNRDLADALLDVKNALRPPAAEVPS